MTNNKKSNKDQFEKAKAFVRNDLGLIEGIRYKFDDLGMVNWRAIIPKNFLFVNEQFFKSSDLPVPESIDGLEDQQVIISLGGLKWLARIRGYKSVDYSYTGSSESNAVVKCTIDWLPNYENKNGCVYSEVASCNAKNSGEFGQKYLESIAANRAFSRCVRNFLNILIVSDVEIHKDTSAKEVSTVDGSPLQQSNSLSINPQEIFLRSAKRNGLSLEEIIAFANENCDDLKDKKISNEAELMANIGTRAVKKLLVKLKTLKKV